MLFQSDLIQVEVCGLDSKTRPDGNRKLERKIHNLFAPLNNIGVNSIQALADKIVREGELCGLNNLHCIRQNLESTNTISKITIRCVHRCPFKVRISVAPGFKLQLKLCNGQHSHKISKFVGQLDAVDFNGKRYFNLHKWATHPKVRHVIRACNQRKRRTAWLKFRMENLLSQLTQGKVEELSLKVCSIIYFIHVFCLLNTSSKFASFDGSRQCANVLLRSSSLLILLCLK